MQAPHLPEEGGHRGLFSLLVGWRLLQGEAKGGGTGIVHLHCAYQQHLHRNLGYFPPKLRLLTLLDATAGTPNLGLVLPFDRSQASEQR
jgi:hypothetical protein